MTMSRVQARGQITVPREIRDACGARPGANILFIQTGADRFECVVLPPRESLLEVIKDYTMDGPAPDLERLRQEMGEQITREVLGRRDHP